MLFQKSGHGSVDAVVNSLDIHRKEPIPDFLFHHGHQPEVHNPGVADQHIYVSHLVKGPAHRLSIRHIAADGGGTGFLRQGLGSVVLFFIQEEHPVALGGKQLHRCRTDSPGTSGNQNH